MIEYRMVVVARELIYFHDENPAEGWKKEREAAQQKLDEILSPAMAALGRGIGQGVDIIKEKTGKEHASQTMTNGIGNSMRSIKEDRQKKNSMTWRVHSRLEKSMRLILQDGI